MSERERQEAFKTVNEFRDAESPDKILTRHVSATGEEPVYVDEETFVSEGKIESGQVQHENLSFRLDELTKDFYMFSLAPVYLTCLWDESTGGLKFDLIYRYGVEMKMTRIPRVVQYKSPIPLFNGSAGEWDHLLQGLPRQDNLPYLFSKWMEQLVFVRREKSPAEYWRVNKKTIKVSTPTIVSQSAEVDIFLPTGVDKRLDVQMLPDGTYTYVQLPPEDWVVGESMRYFGGVDA